MTPPLSRRPVSPLARILTPSLATDSSPLIINRKVLLGASENFTRIAGGIGEKPPRASGSTPGAASQRGRCCRSRDSCQFPPSPRQLSATFDPPAPVPHSDSVLVSGDPTCRAAIRREILRMTRRGCGCGGRRGPGGPATWRRRGGAGR